LAGGSANGNANARRSGWAGRTCENLNRSIENGSRNDFNNDVSHNLSGYVNELFEAKGANSRAGKIVRLYVDVADISSGRNGLALGVCKRDAESQNTISALSRDDWRNGELID